MKSKLLRYLMICLIIPCVFLLNACGDDTNKLVTAPTQKYVTSCLIKVPGIIQTSAVTEGNDPNNLLNKMGGYYASIYFSYSLINQNDISGSTLIEKGTDAGGCLEVYKSKNDADKRNEYLSAFDGSFLASGSHKVVGTIVVRTSNKITATQQNVLQDNIIHALKGEDKLINKNIGSTQSSGGNSGDDLNYDNLVSFPARTAGGISNIDVSYLVYYPTQNADAVYSWVEIEQFTYVFDDYSEMGKLKITINFDCYVMDILDDEFAFKIVAYDNDNIEINSKTVFHNAVLEQRLRIQETITLDISDIQDGVTIDFVDYSI